MAESLRSHLQQRARALDLGRGEALTKIQTILDAKYPDQARAKSLNEGVLKIITASSALASELRLQQQTLIPEFTQATARGINRLHIQITELEAR